MHAIVSTEFDSQQRRDMVTKTVVKLPLGDATELSILCSNPHAELGHTRSEFQLGEREIFFWRDGQRPREVNRSELFLVIAEAIADGRITLSPVPGDTH